LFKPRHRILALAWVCALLFVMGMIQLFLLRFESGDVYPPYSSLRADPLGTRALFESLNRLAAQTAQRNYRSLDQVAIGPGRTLLICGLPDDGRYLSAPLWQHIMDRLAQEGGRLVLSFTPTSRSVEKKDKEIDPDGEDQDQKERDPGPDPLKAGDDEKQACGPSMDNKARWCGQRSLGFELQRAEHMHPDAQALRIGPGPGVLPDAIAHRAPLSFGLQDDAWQILYAWNGAPVVVARAWGSGTLVMAADSYLFSNEALRRTPSANLMAWFVGPHQEVVFDEFHHGLNQSPGIANLARKYRLHGLFFTLLLVTLLFVWRRGAVFVPPLPEAAQPPGAVFADGGSTSEGMVNLMQQHIASKQLLSVCHDAWRASAAARVPEATLAQVEVLVQNRAAHDPVTLYRHICELLEQGKRL
jgi:hypothetical protein